jgi:hypothetical protein
MCKKYTFACKIHTYAYRFSNILLLRPDDFSEHMPEWKELFLHAECDLYTQKCDYITQECNFDTYECDFNTHDCDNDTHGCNFNTLRVTQKLTN